MMPFDESREYAGVTWKECPYDGAPRISCLIERPVVDQAFTADTAEPRRKVYYVRQWQTKIPRNHGS
jgi:hypothetical protein